MSLRVMIAGTLVLWATAGWAAEAETATGVVTNVSSEKRMITIRNENTGQRRTYFLQESTRVTANGSPIELNRLRRGNEVTLRYRTTDRGRVVETVRLPAPEEITDVIPVEVAEVQTVSGLVTGVRPTLRTITIRDDGTRQRRTLKIPESASITRDGQPLVLRNIERGDSITARYHVTDQGLILVTGRAPQPSAQPIADVPAPVALPKTAGHVFAYLFAAFGLFGSAVLMRARRRRRG